MFVPSALATAVTGTATFSGNATVNSGGIFFNDTGVNATNVFLPGSPDTKDFGGLTGGTIKNLVGASMVGPVSISDFVTFNVGMGQIHFDLTKVDAGVGTLAGCSSSAVGSVCTPPNSPFTLIQTAANAVSISLSLEGRAWIVSPAGQTNAVGAFTTQDVTVGKIPTILSTILTGGSIHDSYSASFVVQPGLRGVVPEPATLLLMGVGLLGAGLVARKKITK
ncbi:MAG TPA: PEP-CTERM sorting domain-containing protein [Bryobacteraceae bacterium]